MAFINLIWDCNRHKQLTLVHAQDGLQYAVVIMPCSSPRQSLGKKVCALQRIPKDRHLAEYTGHLSHVAYCTHVSTMEGEHTGPH